MCACNLLVMHANQFTEQRPWSFNNQIPRMSGFLVVQELLLAPSIHMRQA